MSDNAPTEMSPHENQLRLETSPYLLQHRDNPVHWRAWNEIALAEARALDRPILLSIGYAACHWCHVMAHESFEDAATAAVMNARFINIKVDREERPDLDQIYMAALHALGDQGGWPLTMFLTPDCKPIWGGTYFPPRASYGRPGFIDVLKEIADLYQNDRETLHHQAEKITAHLSRRRATAASRDLDATLLDQAADSILSIMDPVRGGTKGAPKFPNIPALDFLARTALRTGRDDCRRMVDVSLAGIANGGIFDAIGGGFARYSVDADWLVPHFEKMLSDNGLLIECLAISSRGSTHAALYRDRIESSIGWIEREMVTEEGAFATSIDADSKGGEGAFYVWQPQQLDELLSPEDAVFIANLYDITPAGNFDGASIPNRLRPAPTLSASDEKRRQQLLATMRISREGRPRPARDDKILADWNGLAISGIATAAMLFDRLDWLEMAERAYRFVSESMSLDGRPSHAWRQGKRVHPGFSADLATLAKAALILQQATGAAKYQGDAIRWLGQLELHHASADGSIYFTADDAEPVLVRRSDRFDDAAPNAHGLAADSLVRLWALTGDNTFRDRADAILAAAAGDILANVFGTASLLSALDLRLEVRTITILVPEGESAEPMRRALLALWQPNWVLDIRQAADALPPTHPAFGKTAIDGKPTAYVCSEGHCSLPVTDAEALLQLLR